MYGVEGQDRARLDEIYNKQQYQIFQVHSEPPSRIGSITINNNVRLLFLLN